MDNIGVTRAFETDQAYASLMSAGVTQNDGRGSYVYDNGTLTLAANTNLGYSVTMDTNQTLDPTDFAYLLANINSDVPFNITMDVTRADGTVASVELRKEFYPLFGGLAEVPEALPAGSWSPAMDLLGYYQWNGGATTSSIIRNITIELEGQGTLVLSDLQAARGIAPANINDGLGASGSYDNTYLITFVSNGGSEVASVSVRDGATVSKPTDATRYGYTFAGWYCNPELTDPYDFSTPVPYSFKLYAKWEASTEEVYDGGMAGDGKIYAEGIDVSYHNGANFNFQAIADAGYDYVILRAGSTNLGLDPQFEAYYAAARAAGLDIGAYFYSYAMNAEDAVADANKCLSYIAGKTFEYPIYFDYEDPTQNELSQAASTEICLAFMDTVANQGYLTGMYSGAYHHGRRVQHQVRHVPVHLREDRWKHRPSGRQCLL